MQVTKLETVTKTKYRVFLDDQFAFVLYKGELSRYGIREGCPLAQQNYESILKEVLPKRAKLRAMHLLNAMPRTEQQLYQKLKEGEYPQEVIEAAMTYVKSFGYINDQAYAENLLATLKDSKSKREIYGKLLSKGLSKELIEQTLEAGYEEGNLQETILRLLRKKHYDPQKMGEKEIQKIMAFLLRKGFSYEEVRSAMRAFEKEDF